MGGWAGNLVPLPHDWFAAGAPLCSAVAQLRAYAK
jgi:hypothetical protein